MEASKDFVTSIILWKDMVPRLSLRSVAKWREALIDALAHAKVSKFHVLRRHNPCYSKSMDRPEHLVLPEGRPPHPAPILAVGPSLYNFGMYAAMLITLEGSLQGSAS